MRSHILASAIYLSLEMALTLLRNVRETPDNHIRSTAAVPMFDSTAVTHRPTFCGFCCSAGRLHYRMPNHLCQEPPYLSSVCRPCACDKGLTRRPLCCCPAFTSALPDKAPCVVACSISDIHMQPLISCGWRALARMVS